MGRTPLRRSSRAVKRAVKPQAIPAPTVSGAAAPAPAKISALPIYGNWMAADAAVVGSSHLRSNPPKPCQDAALANAGTKALVVIADGAGSAAVSHVGAAAVVAGVRRLCRTLEAEVAATLDTESEPPGAAESLAHRIVTHSVGILDDLAEGNLRGAEDFRCTLLVWIVGTHRALWLKVGDGALVAETDDGCHCVGPAGKGEFANQTCFIGPRLTNSQWFWGNIDATQLCGLAAMSDGAAERLVANDCWRAPKVDHLEGCMRVVN